MAEGTRKTAPKVVGGLLAAGVLAMGGGEAAVASACPEHDQASDSGSSTSAGASPSSNTGSSATAKSANANRGSSSGSRRTNSGVNTPSGSGGDSACTDLTGRATAGPCI